jgi:hypothetical protein
MGQTAKDHGGRLKVEGNLISAHIVRGLWEKYFAEKSMPKVEARNLTPKQFFRFIRDAESSKHIAPNSRESMLKEHGHIIPMEKRGGFVFYVKSEDKWIIIRRSNCTVSVTDVLSHEMRHIFESIDAQGRNIRRQ